MTSPQAPAPPSVQRTTSRQAGPLLAVFFGSTFIDKLTDGYSLGMALATAAALACYAVGLYAAGGRPGPA